MNSQLSASWRTTPEYIEYFTLFRDLCKPKGAKERALGVIRDV